MMHAFDLLGAEPTPLTSQQKYEALKQLPAAELRARAQKALVELAAWQTNVLADDNARAYRQTLEQTEWQVGNGDKATTDAEKRLFYARAVHMAAEALDRFKAQGAGDSYWDTAGETAAKMRDWVKGAPGGALEWFTGIPSWALWVGGVAVVGGIGYGVWKIALAAAPAVAGAAARRYMP